MAARFSLELCSPSTAADTRLSSATATAMSLLGNLGHFALKARRSKASRPAANLEMTNGK